MSINPLSDSRFRKLFAAQVIALVGTGLSTVALTLLAYDLVSLVAGAYIIRVHLCTRNTNFGASITREKFDELLNGLGERKCPNQSRIIGQNMHHF